MSTTTSSPRISWSVSKTPLWFIWLTLAFLSSTSMRMAHTFWKRIWKSSQVISNLPAWTAVVATTSRGETIFNQSSSSWFSWSTTALCLGLTSTRSSRGGIMNLRSWSKNDSRWSTSRSYSKFVLSLSKNSSKTFWCCSLTRSPNMTIISPNWGRR